MKGKIISLGAVVFMALTSAWAADVAGKWTATVPGGQGQGESTITLALNVDGEKLTGTLNNTQAPGDVQIAEGKVTGDEISLSLMRDIAGTPTKAGGREKSPETRLSSRGLLRERPVQAAEAVAVPRQRSLPGAQSRNSAGLDKRKGRTTSNRTPFFIFVNLDAYWAGRKFRAR